VIIKCLIKRDSPTEMSHAGQAYLFKPRPELTGNEIDNVCEVCSDHAITRFLECGGLYQEWKKDKPEVDKPELAKTPAHQPPVDNKPLTAETFFAMKNVNQVKAAIRKCNDRDLLDELGKKEHQSEGRRQYVIDELNAQIDSMEKPKSDAELF
jgi:hypothetical protein